MLNKQQKMKELSRVSNKRIDIQKQMFVQDDQGFGKEGWQKYKTVWASVNNLFGKEFYAAKAVNTENTIIFNIRYAKDMADINTKEYRIFWNNRKFDITFIDNIRYENKWLKIKAIEVV